MYTFEGSIKLSTNFQSTLGLQSTFEPAIKRLMAILCGKKWQPSKLAQWILTARCGFLLLVVFGRFLQDPYFDEQRVAAFNFESKRHVSKIVYHNDPFYLIWEQITNTYKTMLAMWLTLEMICDIRGFSYNVLISKYTIFV